ncbi:MAG: hypothetical protein FWD31_01460 [Planctomycetaceae bacterium]|nr:hypothetical protein [Planctomycetaceae bacterium]
MSNTEHLGRFLFRPTKQRRMLHILAIIFALLVFLLPFSNLIWLLLYYRVPDVCIYENGLEVTQGGKTRILMYDQVRGVAWNIDNINSVASGGAVSVGSTALPILFNISTRVVHFVIFPFDAIGGKGFRMPNQPSRAELEIYAGMMEILNSRISQRMLAELDEKGETQWTKDVFFTNEGFIWQKNNQKISFDETVNVDVKESLEIRSWGKRYLSFKGGDTVKVMFEDENFYPGLAVYMEKSPNNKLVINQLFGVTPRA